MIKKWKEKFGKFYKLAFFIVFTLFWILFVYSIGGEWLYFIPLFVADHLFWHTFNYTFWEKRKKKRKNKSELKSWFDAILFAIIAATILRTFLIEAYTIPTSSMEKSLLIGDFLFVSKVAYGPRVPMTPLAVPLVHHTIPIFGSKSYSEIIKIPYYRMKGLGEIQRNDCVVFNWPAETLGRPIDKKENYIKRCVGLPEDTIEIVNGQLMVNSKPQEEFEGIKNQWHYNVQTTGSGLNPKILLEKYDITEGGYGSNQNEYILTLTNESRDAIVKFPNVKSINKRIKTTERFEEYIFPHSKDFSLNEDNYGPLVIPKSGKTINLTKDNLPLYKDLIERYEGNKLEIIGGEILINKKIATTYTFKMNYYWLMGDNRHNSAASRFWGFVPDYNLLGQPVITLVNFAKFKFKFDFLL